MSEFYLIATWEVWNVIDMLRSERLLESLSFIHEKLIAGHILQGAIEGTKGLEKFMGVQDRELRPEGAQET
jgi:hypothetical protein